MCAITGNGCVDRAFERIGHLYPQVKVEISEQGYRVVDASAKVENPNAKIEELTVIAWLWARTVASPNPALNGVHVPLASSFLLSTKKGKEAWVEPVIAEDGKSYRFEVRRLPVPLEKVERTKSGTKTARGANFVCLLSHSPIAGAYIKAEGMAGRMGEKLMAVVAEGKKGRIYFT